MAITSRVTQVAIGTIGAQGAPKGRATQVAIATFYPFVGGSRVTQAGTGVLYPFVPAGGILCRAYLVG